MKTKLLILFLILSTFVFSQNFNRFPFTGYVKGIDNPQEIRIELSLEDSNRNKLFIESHNISTDSLGLFKIVIGDGSASLNQISDINWGGQEIYIRTKFFSNEHPNGNDIGRSKVFSVPYANTAQNLISSSKKINSSTSKNYSNYITYTNHQSNNSKFTTTSSSNNYPIISWTRTGNRIRIYTQYVHLQSGDHLYFRDVLEEYFYSEVIEVHSDGYTCTSPEVGITSGNNGIFNPVYGLTIGEGSSTGFSNIQVDSPNDSSIVISTIDFVGTSNQYQGGFRFRPPTTGWIGENSDNTNFLPIIRASSMGQNRWSGGFQFYFDVRDSERLEYFVRGLDSNGHDYISGKIIF